jgi:hypothetical protein
LTCVISNIDNLRTPINIPSPPPAPDYFWELQQLLSSFSCYITPCWTYQSYFTSKKIVTSWIRAGASAAIQPVIFLKEAWHEIFRIWFISQISFPLVPEYPVEAISKFFETLQICSKVEVNHWCQMLLWGVGKMT